MQPWKKISEDAPIKVGWRTIVGKTFLTPDGIEAKYSINYPSGSRSVATIAITDAGRVVVARQFRQGPELVMEEIPGGMVEPGEEVLAAAERELHEETGYSPAAMKYLGYVYKDAVSNVQSHYYLATGCIKNGEPHLDETEYIEVDTVSIEKLMQNARNGLMTDSDAVLLAYDDLQVMLNHNTGV